MSDPAAAPAANAFEPPGVGLLLKLKIRALKNHLWQTLRETRLKILSAVTAVGLWPR